MNKDEFYIDEFKNWIKIQTSSDKCLQGMQVQPKLSYKKLLDNIYPEDGDVEILAKEFKINGGVIAETNGENFLIKVEAGEFFILKTHVELF